MLARTLSRTHSQSGPRPWRPIIIVTAITLALVAGYLALPSPGPRMREVALNDQMLRAEAISLLAEAPILTHQDKILAELGRVLFHDPNFSANGLVACASCHMPEKSFTDGLPLSQGLAPGSRNTPTVVNTYLGQWFNWDGRSDSLVAQALHAAEDPRQLGSSRVRVVRELIGRYKKPYEAVFGAMPAALERGQFPADGTADVPRLSLPIEVAAHALATLGSFDQLRETLHQAQIARRAPVMELSRKTFGETPDQPLFWIAAFESLNPEERAAIDQVFTNFGTAIAAFERGLSATQSPFDQFARRVKDGALPADALGTGFSDQELAGFKLFVGPARCSLCHSGPGFSDQQFHNIGLPALEHAGIDAGRATGVLRVGVSPFPCDDLSREIATSESCRERPFLNPKNLAAVGSFKTPSLRNISATAPYMHDGRFATMSEVIVHFDAANSRPAIGTREGTIKPLKLTYEETAAIEAFLTALTAPIQDSSAPDKIGQNSSDHPQQ